MRIAVRMGYTPARGRTFAARPVFLHDYTHKNRLNRSILDHLLHDVSGASGGPSPSPT